MSEFSGFRTSDTGNGSMVFAFRISDAGKGESSIVFAVWTLERVRVLAFLHFASWKG